MKCTNFREELDLIHQKELNELIAALEAHGGEYEFADEDAMDDLEVYPQVVVKMDYELKVFRVMKAAVNKYDHPYLLGKVVGDYCGDDYVEEVDAKDVLTGDMLYIISMMDEPENKEFPLEYYPKPREFRKGEEVMVLDTENGAVVCGVISQDATVTHRDEVVLVGYHPTYQPIEEISVHVLKIAKDKVCPKCGEPLCLESYPDNEYPYYCPECDENFVESEVG